MSRENCCAAKGLRHSGYQPFYLALHHLCFWYCDSIGHRFLLVLRAEIRGDERSNRFESGHPCGAQ